MRKALSTLVYACASLIAMAPVWLYAQPTSTGQDGARVITTAAPFLSIGPDSRAGGMGEAGVALPTGPNAMHWNPASMAFNEGSMGLGLSYSPWLRSLGIPDINLAYLSGYFRTHENGVAGASLRYFSLGTIQLTSLGGDNLGEENPNEFALDVGYSLKVTPDLSAGIALRYFNSALANGSPDLNLRAVNSVAGDIAFYYEKPFRIQSSGNDLPVTFSSGLNISNIGPKVSYTAAEGDRDFIPVNLRFGYAFKFEIDEYNSITFTNDFNKLLVPSRDSVSNNPVGSSEDPLLSGIFGSFSDNLDGFSGELREVNVGLGAEYWYREFFAARAGFFYEHPQYGDRTFITLGVGIRYSVLGFDFSFLAPLRQSHPLQNTLRLTLLYTFDEEAVN